MSAEWRVLGFPVRRVFESGAFAAALSTAIVGTAFASFALRQLMGWPGLLAVLGTLTVLAAGSFVARRGTVEWHGLLPISLMVFVGWSVASIIWSQYRLQTAEGALYQLVLAFLGIYLALVRDTIQVVRTVGDVLRLLLAVSLGVEIVSGLLLDSPFPLLNVQGLIGYLGPIQGVFGTRNALGLVALIALVTFYIEWRTRSVTRAVAWFSVPLAIVSALLSRSPVVAVVLVVVLFGMLALALVRRVTDVQRRFYWQVGLASFVVVAGVTAWLLRERIIGALNAQSALQVRYPIWLQVWYYTHTDHTLVGWGWLGAWRPELFPYVLIDAYSGGSHDNALNAYLDVLLQLGWVGALLFAVLIVLALGRSWLVASNRRSVIHSWSPLVLIALLATSMAESAILVDYGWLLLVICTVKASQNMSWRSALPPRPEGPPLASRR